MEKINLLKFGIGFLLCLSVGISFGQPGWNWPEDKATAQEKNALYNDYMKEGRLEAALEPFNWLLENAPDLNRSLYINGVKIYDELAEKAKDPGKKSNYEAKVLELYDKRINYFPEDEASVLNRKAYDAYKFWKDDKEKYDELFQLYEKTFEINGNDVGVNNLVAYMDVIRRYKLTGGEISDGEILDRYDKVLGIIDEKMKTSKRKEALEKTREFVDKLLTSVVTVDCEFISTKLAPKLKEDPSNVNLAKKVIGLSLANKCSEDESFLEAAKAVQEAEPTFGIAKVIALKANSAGDYETADKYFQEAIELAENDEAKGQIYYAMAASNAKRGQKVTARSNSMKAVQFDPSLKEAYKLVGDLYLSSYNECKEGVSKVQDRAIYLAAYEMYKKAGDSRMMRAAEEQFPSIEEIFELDFKEGQTIKVGCWINETVTLKRRPSSS